MTLLTMTLALSACGSVGGSGAQPGALSPPVVPSVTSPPGPVAVPSQALRAALGCPADIAVSVDHRVDVPTTHRAAVVAAHCESAAGSPPSGVYLVTASTGGSRITATLLPASEQIEVRTLTGTQATVRIGGLGYSAPKVPRCCPDVTVARTWTVRGDRLVPAG